MVTESNTLIFQEFNTEERTNWFDMKQKKFLHTIDTFYYSVKLENDFTKESSDPACLALRDFFKKAKSDLIYKEDVIPFYCPGLQCCLNIVSGCFDKFYNIRMQCPQLFDVFIAEIVPPGPDGTVSYTSEIVVQIRSSLLWQYGATKAFEYTYEAVKAICSHFNLQIAQVKENRTDFCWHSNYLQKPEKYFMPDKMNQMFVSRLGRKKKDEGTRFKYMYMMHKDGTIENDYVAIGERGDKCFLRIYNKTKEVIQQGYKSWFLKEWLFNGLINRYDFYVLEKCYKEHSWKYMTKARLQFYLEYGQNESVKKDIRAILDEVVKPADTTVKKFADQLTPKVTVITNVEFQVMRRLTKSMIFPPIHDNSDKQEARRIYDFLDMRSVVSEYLTHEEFRLVNRTEENKSRCECNAFWKALRSVKFVDVKKPPKEIKLQRDYTRNLDAYLVRRRAMSAAVSYSLYTKGLNNLSPYEDAADLLCTLNDNDVEYMDRLKKKRGLQLNNLLYAEPSLEEERTFTIIKNETGEVL